MVERSIGRVVTVEFEIGVTLARPHLSAAGPGLRARSWELARVAER
jgi:hypothetical protein